jgi:glycine dehydrogenase
MLSKIGYNNLEDFSRSVVPKNIQSDDSGMDIEKSSEIEVIKRLKKIADKNKVFKSWIGMGYYGTITPTVIQRNILENPGWYTQYTPYQAEISQGRLEALLNYQTTVADLTNLPLANASLLDEGTAAAEAMVMFFNSTKDAIKNTYFVSEKCHPQTIEVIKTRAEPIGINVIVDSVDKSVLADNVFGVLLQYPDTEGKVKDFSNFCQMAKANKSFVCMATDLLALSILKSPGEMGADAAIGNSQRFGVPMGFGGPHAAFFATTNNFKRKIPGRIIGVSKDQTGNRALRMALQTREQHIRREKATSNICTAQVLLAVISGMYAVYHGREGIFKIGSEINRKSRVLAKSFMNAGYDVENLSFFDTIKVKVKTNDWKARSESKKINFRDFNDGSIGISLDETTTIDDIDNILSIFNIKSASPLDSSIPIELKRDSVYLEHPVFKKYRSETQLLRYMHMLESKDLSLNTSMIPLGSCTMKLNSTTEMVAVTWPEFSNIHPFSPHNQTKGYFELIDELSDSLVSMTGFDSISMQPNSGAQGEYAGLMVIRAYHKFNGDHHRNICLIPASAHGTNPASAVMAGMKVIVVKCDSEGNIDETDFREKIKLYSKTLSSVMITYPSTHGVFEENIKELCQTVHDNGGQVYMDGANLNALVGLCKPGDFGADVMHINLHKTFCIPHGGGGPGMGPIVCKNHLAPFLPGHLHSLKNRKTSISSVSAAPFGSSSILPISWAYITMMGTNDLKKATQVAILNANYMAKRLEKYYPILYRGTNDLSAHEFIIDIRSIKDKIGISEEDIAKRLMDYGYHAPTMSWPVPGTMMIEPTESESKIELDRFCDAMISIKKEIDKVASGDFDKDDNPLKNAPHTANTSLSDEWNHKYSRYEACFPAEWQKEHKYWPSIGRIDNAFGDRNLICTCPPIDDYDS